MTEFSDIDVPDELVRELGTARERTFAIGQLAGGIAHDLNNLLTGIAWHAGEVLRLLPLEHPVRSKITKINDTIESAAGLTSQLLTLARRQILEPKGIQVNKMLIAAGVMLTRLVGKNIEFQLQPGEDLWKIHVDPNQFDQLLINLVVNARDAMPAGGRLQISTSNIPDLDGDGPHVMLAVKDTGSAVGKHTRLRIFEPFFATRKLLPGSGLGRATVCRIVDQNGGRISVETTRGYGSTVRVCWPVSLDRMADQAAD